jgi:hypothetical protein
MFGQTFYFSTIRKYVALFGTLFNDIHITRSINGAQTQLIKVPITYGPKEKMLTRLIADPNIDRQQATITQPVMSFEMSNIQYDSARKLHTIGRSAVSDPDNKNKFKYQYNPVPYNIDFTLAIYVKNAEDGTKILEQILPYFTPDWTTTVNLIPEMNIKMDIPVILNSVSCEDTYEGEFTTRRSLIWTLTFTLKGYIYGPVRKSAVIKFASVPFYIPSVPDGELASAVGVTPVAEKVTVQPGLTANGQPTSNISNTIPYTEIEVTDDFGFITQIENGPINE